MAAHQSKVSARNDDYKRIMVESERRLASSAFESVDNLDGLFFGGDLNYRLDLGKEEVELALLDAGTDELLDCDQLTKARAAGDAFDRFEEGPVYFRPTFKFDKSSGAYDTSKKRRVPAWTDRVLFCRPNAGATSKGRAVVDLVEYDAAMDVRRSDHRPVFAKFRLIPEPGRKAAIPGA
jgi:hypothetical protein